MLGDRSDDLKALWKSVRDRTQRALATVGVTRVPRLKRAEGKKLDLAIDRDIPALRSEATG